MKKALAKFTTEEFKEHFSKVSKDRFENDPAEIDEAVAEAEDLRGVEKARIWQERLNAGPEKV